MCEDAETVPPRQQDEMRQKISDNCGTAATSQCTYSFDVSVEQDGMSGSGSIRCDLPQGHEGAHDAERDNVVLTAFR